MCCDECISGFLSVQEHTMWKANLNGQVKRHNVTVAIPHLYFSAFVQFPSQFPRSSPVSPWWYLKKFLHDVLHLHRLAGMSRALSGACYSDRVNRVIICFIASGFHLAIATISRSRRSGFDNENGRSYGNNQSYSIIRLIDQCGLIISYFNRINFVTYWQHKCTTRLYIMTTPWNIFHKFLETKA